MIESGETMKTMRHSILAILLLGTILSIQSYGQASLELVPLHGDADSVVFQAKMTNPSSGSSILLEAVFVTVSYDPQKLEVIDSSTAIMNHRFGSQNWISYSNPILNAFQPSNADTAQYGESSQTIGQGITIPKNVTLNLCTFKFRPKTHPDCSPITIIGNRVNLAYTGYYTVSGADNNPFSPATGLSPICWTPVEFMSFNADQQGKTIVLRWVTATETNNYGFFVERRAVSANEVDWQELDFVEGHGTTNADQSYYFLDMSVPHEGLYEYRLRQQDFDGTFDYSPIRSVQYVAGANGFELQPAYPNPVPAGLEANFRFTLPERSRVSLTVQNLLGQEVALIEKGEISEGTFTR
ncbi:MAG: hypothetical protein CL946_13120, partial [Ectothiorhodospiraceae bacterium]|nr:hypothetical protein [Ectothiorhodospiraceae bacterium]